MHTNLLYSKTITNILQGGMQEGSLHCLIAPIPLAFLQILLWKTDRTDRIQTKKKKKKKFKAKHSVMSSYADKGK